MKEAGGLIVHVLVGSVSIIIQRGNLTMTMLCKDIIDNSLFMQSIISLQVWQMEKIIKFDERLKHSNFVLTLKSSVSVTQKKNWSLSSFAHFYPLVVSPSPPAAVIHP